VMSASAFQRQIKLLHSWPAVEATVVRSRVVPLATDSGEVLYDAEYTFAFSLPDGVHIASAGSNHQSTSQVRKLKQIARFPAGSRHRILYNPVDPSDIRIQPGYNVHFFAVPLFIAGAGLIFGLVGLGCSWGARRIRGERIPVSSSGPA
jgi:hypothetical protein